MESAKSNTQDRQLLITRTFDAPIDLVWEMWTKPEHIANWWGPDGFTNTISKMDLRPGGEWNLIMHGPDGTDYPNRSVFREVIAHKRIVYEHLSDPKFITTVEFHDQGDKTFLTWEMLFNSAEQLEAVVKKYGAREGLKQNVKKLELYLAERRRQ
ncbi:MAG: SRPBCC family protein [Bacteroidota bacterium]|nr:SRPBCC family protein [Bacteroidota bacterium]MDP4215826.1 SRPBCC family protein [Bacteroidota bacterium]MDP4246557.1 SRPBCC family protein [Bacteroidota bacterium]MDP4260438.1 SRPBCC family protein [Bacteroidota bacterium]